MSCFGGRGALGAEQRHRKAQGTPQTAYNENTRFPRKAILEPDRTCSCLRIHYMGLGTCWGESQNEVQEFVAHAGGVGLGGHPIVVRRSLRCAKVLVWYLEKSPTEY